MLAIQTYRFSIGTKIPFSDCPQIIRKYLQLQSLHYERFLYYFHDNSRLPKVIKDCPDIGPVRSRTINGMEHLYLSNIGSDHGCTEAEIMGIVPKIHRRYGLSEAHIIYQDIDFFSAKIPSVIQSPGNNPQCIKGSSISLYRDCAFPAWNSIDLRIVVHTKTAAYDSAPYFEALKQLLPGLRHTSFLECCLSDEEQAQYDKLNQGAAALLVNASCYLSRHLPAPLLSDNPGLAPNLSVAPVLKKLSKQHGYTYLKHEYGCFYIQKRTQNGNYILLDIDVGPNFKGLSLLICYAGAGFKHRITSGFYHPQDQKDLETYVQQCFQALLLWEKEALPALEAHYPPSPDWFCPMP